MIAPRPIQSPLASVTTSEPVRLKLAEPAEAEESSHALGLLVGTSRLKRWLDISAILLMSPVVLPVMGVIAMAIRMDSFGPILITQRRVGRHGRSFRMWKFRSMVVDAEARLARHLASDPAAREEWEANQKLRSDPRVTPLGKLLRRSSLDELPQLWNVLRGEMSLVGPRPIVRDEVERYHKVYPLYTQSRPGLTGLWQVSGRSNISYARRIVLDQIYIRRWSIGMDLKILLRTVPAVLFGRGAY